MKIESHNHPSAVEPYQGAATGVGGIIRDIFAMGARPICGLDSLRFGEIKPLPAAGTARGRRRRGGSGARRRPTIGPSRGHLNRQRYLFEQVVAGIGGYGNCMGIPTVAGEIYFEDPYAGNCLVNAMTVGLVSAGRDHPQQGRRRGQPRGAHRVQDRAATASAGPACWPARCSTRPWKRSARRSRWAIPSPRRSCSRPVWSCCAATCWWRCRTWARPASPRRPARWRPRARWASTCTPTGCLCARPTWSPGRS